jgi:hypothetical protein
MKVASELSRFGVTLRIVDKAAQRTDKSKALVVWSRTLELLNRGPGGAARFIEAAFNATAVSLLAADGQLMGHVSMEAIRARVQASQPAVAREQIRAGNALTQSNDPLLKNLLREYRS